MCRRGEGVSRFDRVGYELGAADHVHPARGKDTHDLPSPSLQFFIISANPCRLTALCIVHLLQPMGAQRLLGLGDVLIPGISCALLRRFDIVKGYGLVRRRLPSRLY